MWLQYDEHMLRLKRITPTSVVLSESLDAPPRHAYLVVRIDNETFRSRVLVVRGLSKNRNVAKIKPVKDGDLYPT